MRLIDSRADHLSKYLNTESAKRLLAWDARSAGSANEHIEVYCVLGWRDVTRALSATKLIESEMRRGARAILDAFGEPSTRGSLPSSPDRFLQSLAEFPQPHHTNVSGLDIVEVSSLPLAFRLAPTNDTHVALSHAAASMVGYALAGYGQPFTMGRIVGRNGRASDFELAAVSRLIERGVPDFAVIADDGFRVDDVAQTYYQAVSSPPVREFGFEVHLVVQCLRDEHIELVHGWY